MSKDLYEKSTTRRGRSRSRRKSEDRLLKKSREHQQMYLRRELSPLTKTCPRRSVDLSSSKRRYHDSLRDARSPSPRSRRKIVLLSPVRMNKSVREVIMDERDMRKDDNHSLARSPGKKRIKDRLGIKKENHEEIEVYNMDTSQGRCGAVAVVKEYIDNKSGIMELKMSEGGSGAVIVFSAEQVWVADRKRDPNGPPKKYVESRSSNSLEAHFPVGQEVLMNARRVPSDLVDMQATAVWPKFTEIPRYKISSSKLNGELDKFHDVCKIDELVPVCINGLAPVGSLNIWSARVRQVVDKDWGIVEIKSVPRDGKREFSFRFFCIFHKHDVWLEEGIRVGDYSFYKDKPLGEIVELLQPVDIVTRSIVREKGLAMKKALRSTVEMQALCVSLKPSCIPKGAPSGTRVEGGPGAFGGSNRGETPYMFKKGLEYKLNIKLAEYLQVSGKVFHNLDPNLVVKLDAKVQKLEKEPVKIEKKVHKLTPVKPLATTVGPVTVDCQNNVITSVSVKKMEKDPPLEKLSNETARVKKYFSDSVGLLENVTKDWMCLFQTSDCVLIKGKTSKELYPVGTKIQLNANLVDSSKIIQYIASCVWTKSGDAALILPNTVESQMIPKAKISVYNEMNILMQKKIVTMQPPHLNVKTGIIVKILDDNFGVIKQDDKMVLFDTCDFWICKEATAAQSSKSLPGLVSVGDSVLLHAALVQSSSQIPYLATAVWKDNPSPFPADKCPVAVMREKIHPDKIRIYEMVSRCSALKEEHPKVIIKSKVQDQKGYVKLAFKFQGSSGFSAAIAEFTQESSDKKMFAFYLAGQSLESHEKNKVCVPGTKVYFNAVPTNDKDFPVSHFVTAVSQLHSRISSIVDLTKTVEETKDMMKKILEKVPKLSALCSGKPQVISLNLSANNSLAIVDCFPTGRLVCMLDSNAGILEDHNRELAYFEKTDLNLSSKLEMKDVVMVMTRCRDVTIRFQASPAMDGPVKMIVNDGTVAISSNVERYHPEVVVKKAKICTKLNSFSQEKITRAKTAVELYKVDKILTPDYIIDSGEFPSTLVKTKRFSGSSSSNVTEVPLKSEEVKTVTKQSGRVQTILNDSFCLLEFHQEDGQLDFCLFDTFDLYLEGGRTAAQSKLTVGNVLEVNMEVYFHACEISPGCAVPWLATGVWRPEITSQPRPVPRNRITKEKVKVFKTVGESCKVLITRRVVPDSVGVGDAIVTQVDTDCIVLEEEVDDGVDVLMEEDVSRKITKEQNTESNGVRKLKEETNECKETLLSQVEIKDAIEETNLLEKEEDTVVIEITKASDGIKNELSETVCANSSDFDADQATCKIEESVIVEKNVSELVELALQSGEECSTEVNVGGLELVSEDKEMKDSGKENFVTMKENPASVDSSVLPEILSDASTIGTLTQVLGDNYAIFTLDSPAGARALLHKDRVWHRDRAVGGGAGWEELTVQEEERVRVRARRIRGIEEFDYQVIFAHVGVPDLSSDVGELSYTPELTRFTEEKQDEVMLDAQIKMFKEKE